MVAATVTPESSVDSVPLLFRVTLPFAAIYVVGIADADGVVYGGHRAARAGNISSLAIKRWAEWKASLHTSPKSNNSAAAKRAESQVIFGNVNAAHAGGGRAGFEAPGMRQGGRWYYIICRSARAGQCKIDVFVVGLLVATGKMW